MSAYLELLLDYSMSLGVGATKTANPCHTAGSIRALEGFAKPNQRRCLPYG